MEEVHVALPNTGLDTTSDMAPVVRSAILAVRDYLGLAMSTPLGRLLSAF